MWSILHWLVKLFLEATQITLTCHWTEMGRAVPHVFGRSGELELVGG